MEELYRSDQAFVAMLQRNQRKELCEYRNQLIDELQRRREAREQQGHLSKFRGFLKRSSRPKMSADEVFRTMETAVKLARLQQEGNLSVEGAAERNKLRKQRYLIHHSSDDVLVSKKAKIDELLGLG